MARPLQWVTGSNMLLVLAAILSLFIGLSLGLLGGGGSILTLPILVYVLHVEPRTAIAMSLLVVGITSATGVVAHARAGRVRFRTGLVFGVAGMAGAFAGGRIAHFLPSTFLLVAFGAVMLAASAMMMRGRKESPTPPAIEPRLAKALAVGAAVGVVAGLVGAGGGFLIVPALVLFGGLAMPEAIGTSLLVIALQSLAGFAGHAGQVELDLPLTAIVTTSAVAGGFAGARLSRVLSPALLRRGFAWFVLVMALFLLGKQIPPDVFANASGEFMNHFTPMPALLGGAIIGLSTSALLLFNGRIAGISGIFGGLLVPKKGDVGWRTSFLAGLIVGGLALAAFYPAAFPTGPLRPIAVVAIAGLLVGYGTRLGNGCTSGHGVCGVSRLSARSTVATISFMVAGAVAVFFAKHVLGGIG